MGGVRRRSKTAHLNEHNGLADMNLNQNLSLRDIADTTRRVFFATHGFTVATKSANWTCPGVSVTP